MKIICTRCGSTKITCEAWINPNESTTQEVIDHFSDDSFNYGNCQACNQFVSLIDVDEVRKNLKEKYLAYKDESEREPFAACCEITYCSKKNGTEEVLVKIGCDAKGNKNYFPFCEDIEGLEFLCDKTNASFIITEVYSFE